MLVNALRGHMADLGSTAPQGIGRVADLVAVLVGEDTTALPVLARQAFGGLAAELEALGNRAKEIEAAILAWHKGNEASCRLAAIPGVGPITASAIVATVTDPTQLHPATAAGAGRDRGDPTCAHQARPGHSLAAWRAGAPPGPVCLRGAGQHNGAHRLGAADARRKLPRSGHCAHVGSSGLMP